MTPSRMDEADWSDYLERRRRRAPRVVLDPASALLARRAVAETPAVNPQPTEPKEITE